MIDPISIYVGYRLGKGAYDALTQEEKKPDRIIFKRDGQVVAEYPFDEAMKRVKAGEIPFTDTYWHEGMEEWKLVSESAAARSALRERGEIPELPFPRPPTIDELKVIKALLTNLQAAGEFYLWPDIPNEKLTGAKSTFLQLREDELLLALCDTTVFAKNAKDGFALTTKRVYWRDLWLEPKEIEYAHLVGPVDMKNGCQLGGGDSIGGPFPELGDLPRFFQGAARAFGTPVRVSGSTNVEEDLDELIKPLLAKLDRLAGLERVKKDLRDLTNLVRINLLRKKQGFKTPERSLHMVFYGSPGTGKTTVARLIGQIYRSLGVLPKGHCVETDRAGLVAGYVGQTAIKTTEVLNNALGGVLFIDEAYTLTPKTHGEDPFGQEAVDTLLKFMEDHRKELVVIVAGYSDQMNRFITSNPGLQSRFPNYLFFDDYTPDQLTHIFRALCEDSDYSLGPEAEQKLSAIFAKAYAERDHTFSNARLVRNLFEKTLSNQASRLITFTAPSREALLEISAVDIA